VGEPLSVTVIIRTGAAKERGPLLQRAIASVLAQPNVQTTCIVVVNGLMADPAVVEALREDRRLQCIVDLRADKRAATLIGRQAVRTEFFAYLDDDDEFLIGGLALRAQFLRNHPDIACVATNGEYVRDGAIAPVFSEGKRIKTDYVGSLLRHQNWLASCGGTFRTALVGQQYFADLPLHREWTLIAYRIATRLPVEYLDVLTYRVYCTPSSQSKQPTYINAGAHVARLMLAWRTEARRERVLLRNENRAYRSACSYYRIAGDFWNAWRFYLRAIMSPFGIGFLPYAVLLIVRCQRPVAELAPAVPWFARAPLREK
jgi:glycosyltransferase involved in cell wall biosynthesis